MDMDQPDESVRDEAVAALLRASTPRPDFDFARRLEERLGPASEPSSGWRVAFVPAVGLAVTAGAFLILGLAGTGPLSLTDDETKATDDCRYVRINEQRRLPSITSDRQGRPRIVFEQREVTALRRRCR